EGVRLRPFRAGRGRVEIPPPGREAKPVATFSMQGPGQSRDLHQDVPVTDGNCCDDVLLGQTVEHWARKVVRMLLREVQDGAQDSRLWVCPPGSWWGAPASNFHQH